jgi:hypothetical protein
MNAPLLHAAPASAEPIDTQRRRLLTHGAAAAGVLLVGLRLRDASAAQLVGAASPELYGVGFERTHGFNKEAVQIASVQEALRGVARNLMKNHLHHCAARALRSVKKEDADGMYDELLGLIYTHLR